MAGVFFIYKGSLQSWAEGDAGGGGGKVTAGTEDANVFAIPRPASHD